MRAHFSKILLAAGILLFSAQAAFASTDEQMLPPTEPGSTTACGASSGNLLFLNDSGTNSESMINCNGHFKADKDGDVTIDGTLNAGATTLSALDVISTTTLGVLNAGAVTVSSLSIPSVSCTSTGAGFQLLTSDSSGVHCTGATDLTNKLGTPIGETILPTCLAGDYLYSTDGLTFSCAPLPVPATAAAPVECDTPGYALQYDTAAGYSCVLVGLGASCPAATLTTITAILPATPDRDAVSYVVCDADDSDCWDEIFQCQNGTWVTLWQVNP